MHRVCVHLLIFILNAFAILVRGVAPPTQFLYPPPITRGEKLRSGLQWQPLPRRLGIPGEAPGKEAPGEESPSLSSLQGLASAHTALRGKIGGLLKVAVYASASGPRGKDPPHIGDNLVAPWREDIVWMNGSVELSCF